MQSEQWAEDNCVAEFRDGFKQNLYEMMVAKGMNTRGPFAELGEMTYPEKKGSDLAIVPDLNFKIAFERLGGSAGWSSVKYVFKVTVLGDLVLSAVEPLSGEKMWFKKIDLPSRSRTTTIETAGGTEGLPAIQNALNNECGALLRSFFDSAMPAVSKYLSAEEMAQLKRQSQELRTKKVF
ncbi:MAG: hypothetical protein HYZ28_25810 [Myxococcales bacterium]|nr:hypothetical protein [Myxococcales bacterium]